MTLRGISRRWCEIVSGVVKKYVKTTALSLFMINFVD